MSTNCFIEFIIPTAKHDLCLAACMSLDFTAAESLLAASLSGAMQYLVPITGLFLAATHHAFCLTNHLPSASCAASFCACLLKFSVFQPPNTSNTVSEPVALH